MELSSEKTLSTRSLSKLNSIYRWGKTSRFESWRLCADFAGGFLGCRVASVIFEERHYIRHLINSFVARQCVKMGWYKMAYRFDKPVTLGSCVRDNLERLNPHLILKAKKALISLTDRFVLALKMKLGYQPPVPPPVRLEVRVARYLMSKVTLRGAVLAAGFFCGTYIIYRKVGLRRRVRHPEQESN